MIQFKSIPHKCPLCDAPVKHFIRNQFYHTSNKSMLYHKNCMHTILKTKRIIKEAYPNYHIWGIVALVHHRHGELYKNQIVNRLCQLKVIPNKPLYN